MGNRGAYIRAPGTKLVEVQCYCGREFVKVAIELIGFVTGTCDDPECGEWLIPVRG